MRRSAAPTARRTGPAGRPLRDTGDVAPAEVAPVVESRLLPGPSSLPTPHGALPLPIYLPDATLGVVRAVDADDLRAAGIEGLVMNVFHLMQKPGSSTVEALGGLHRMAAWPHPIVTDSGGFQAYSLIRQNPKFGSLSARGISFQPENAERTFLLTPEKSVQLQLAYGADVVICLDDCTHADDPLAEQRRSVDRTVAWAARCRAEFDRQIAQRSLHDGRRPLLFAVVQGGNSAELRRECAEALLAIGFDGYGYGGWPLDAQGRLLAEMLAFCRELIPIEFPMHALGVGEPGSVVDCARAGYGIFDSALPTRDARGGRLYAFVADPYDGRLDLHGTWHRTVYIQDKKHIKEAGPLSPACRCHTCQRYSTGYLHHLYRSDEALYNRLATIHNLHFMCTVIAALRGERTAAAPTAEV